MKIKPAYNFLRLSKVFVLIFIFTGCKLIVPSKYRNYLSDEPWDNIRLASSNEKPELSDSMAIIRSNRTFHPEQTKFMGDEIDTAKRSRTFLVVCKDNKWTVFLVQSVSEAIEHINRTQNLVVYVEGMGKNFYQATNRSLGMAAQYKVTVVMMDYPSINPLLGMTKNFRLARKNSYDTAPDLVNLLKEMQKDKMEEKPWTKVNWTLFHHSMGNIMLRRILLEKKDTLLKPHLFDLVILNAACTQEKDHHIWLERSQFGRKFILNYNKDDRQLRGAKLLTFTSQLGLKPKKPLANNTSYVDFNPLVGSRHSTFADIPLRPLIKTEAKRYFSLLFNGIHPDFSNSTYFGPAKIPSAYYLK